MRTFPTHEVGKIGDAMVRKILWSGLYAGLAAAATMSARRAATSVWRLATGEDPPAKR